jgi:MFS family permease
MQVTPNEMRAVVSALFYFVISVVGLGVGPTSVALLMLTVREPVRRGRLQAGEPVGWNLGPAGTQLRNHWCTYGGLYVGMSVMTIMAYGIGAWIPEHFRRSYGWNIGQVSLWYGLILVIGGPVGAILGGWMADRFYRKHDDGYLRAGLVGLALLLPGYCLFAVMPNPWLSLLFLVPATLGGAIPTTVATACLMQVTPNEMRAVVSALFYFVISVVGLGVGPTSVALLTDFYFHDEAMLRYSLTIVAVVAGLAAVALLLWVRPHFRRSVVAAREWSGEARGSAAGGH